MRELAYFRFSENGWPKLKSNTGHRFDGVNYICFYNLFEILPE